MLSPVVKEEETEIFSVGFCCVLFGFPFALSPVLHFFSINKEGALIPEEAVTGCANSFVPSYASYHSLHPLRKWLSSTTELSTRPDQRKGTQANGRTEWRAWGGGGGGGVGRGGGGGVGGGGRQDRGDDGRLSGSVPLPCARSPGFHPRQKEFRIIKHLGLFPSNFFFF